MELNDAKPPEAPKSPAEPLPVRDEPYRLSSSLRPRWWFPLLASSAAETIAGVETGGSDALGFHQYQAQVIASWGEDQDQYDYSLIYSYDRLYPTLTAAILQADNSISDLVLDNPAETNPLIRYYYQETRRRLVGLVTVPYRRYWWQSLITVGVVSDRYEEHLPFPVERDRLRDIGIFEGTLQGIRAGLAFQSARQFGYSVSPESGILATIDYEDLGESFGGDADVRQLRGDLRGYIPIPLRRAPLGRHVLALRAAGGFTEGDFLFQRELRLGGADVGQLLRLDTTHFPVRGFSSSELRGQNAAVGSIEYRFPLRQIERGPAVYPIYFQRILGDVFYDIGTVWNDDPVALPGLTRGASEAFEQGRTLASVGAEVALDLFFGYFVPVRYRVGVAYLLEGPQRSDVGSAQLYLTAGISF